MDVSSLKLMPLKFSQLLQTFPEPGHQKPSLHGQECLAVRNVGYHGAKQIMLEGENVSGIFVILVHDTHVLENKFTIYDFGRDS